MQQKTASILVRRLSLAGAMALSCLMVAGQEPAKEAAPDTDQARRHWVFAHYMVCYGNSVEFYKSEIELAQRNGVDGFALNCGAWFQNQNYIKSAEGIYRAAKELGTDFKLMFSVDWLGIRDYERDMYDMVKRFYKHPNQFRHQGKAAISTYGGRPEGYVKTIRKLADEGLEIFFVPNLSQQRYSANRSLESTLQLLDSQPFVGGLFYFAVDGSVAEIMRTNATMRRATMMRDKVYMAGACPSYNSPNVRDHYGIEGYDAIWRSIIRDGADWVEIVTWNDYNEDSNLMPFRWSYPRNTERQYNDHDETFLDATAYYTAWYKSGRRPEIKQDRVYVAYRNRSHWLRRAWDVKQEKWIDLTMEKWPFDQVHDDALDNIYATTMLTAPAELTIELAGKTHTFRQPEGVAHVRVPMAGGVPRFDLSRDGNPVLEFCGRKRIITRETQTKTNSTKGYHLLNRTWTGGAAIGDVVARLEAEEGELLAGAEIAEVAGAKVVQNQATDGSGFKVAVRGLKTAAYNVRVRYSNPSDVEARLTMTADGPSRAENDAPYYIPLPLPPTGEGQLRTVSFLWSLYADTTWIQVQWLRTEGKGRNAGHPLSNDQGTPLMDAIELVKVEPFAVPEPRDSVFPEMVPVPGGTFTMGSKDGRPDEQPEHQVTVSPFAMSKYEVTNEEYERFDPKHRKHRDGYSWRDREPVIYVSWVDGARYCNWLSEQAGLSPAYREDEIEIPGEKKKRKGWVTDLSADGFRMPTEAEWEYVAKGRGENRRYPWGNEEPVPGGHGHFQGAAALSTDPRLPSQYAKGAMVVGSYPEGASRDGVMDLAGNVCEWCSDWLEPYSAGPAKDPIGRTPGNYRSIRGSSWGYYGYPVEAVDREYNNPNYPGYIYIGLRIVLPEAGWKKVAGRKK